MALSVVIETTNVSGANRKGVRKEYKPGLSPPFLYDFSF